MGTAVNTTDRTSLPLIEEVSMTDQLALLFDAAGMPAGMGAIADLKAPAPSPVAEQSSGFGVTPYHYHFAVDVSKIEWIEVTVADRRPEHSARVHTQRFTLAELQNGAHGWAHENPNFHGIELVKKLVSMGGGQYDFDIAYLITANGIAFAIEEYHGGQLNTWGFVKSITIRAPAPVQHGASATEFDPTSLQTQIETLSAVVGSLNDAITANTVIDDAQAEHLANIDALLAAAAADPESGAQVITLATNVGSQSQQNLRDLYDASSGEAAPGVVPQEVKDAAATLGLAGNGGPYAIYVGESNTLYSQDVTGQDWIPFAASFSAMVAKIYTFR